MYNSDEESQIDCFKRIEKSFFFRVKNDQHRQRQKPKCEWRKKKNKSRNEKNKRRKQSQRKSNTKKKRKKKFRRDALARASTNSRTYDGTNCTHFNSRQNFFFVYQLTLSIVFLYLLFFLALSILKLDTLRSFFLFPDVSCHWTVELTLVCIEKQKQNKAKKNVNIRLSQFSAVSLFCCLHFSSPVNRQYSFLFFCSF